MLSQLNFGMWMPTVASDRMPYSDVAPRQMVLLQREVGPAQALQVFDDKDGFRKNAQNQWSQNFDDYCVVDTNYAKDLSNLKTLLQGHRRYEDPADVLGAISHLPQGSYMILRVTDAILVPSQNYISPGFYVIKDANKVHSLKEQIKHGSDNWVTPNQ